MRKRKKIKLQQEAEQHITDEVLHQDDDEVLSGLYLFGEVIDRSKKTIPQTSTEVVTYEIQDKSGRRYYVDEYSPQNYLERGENVEIPVYVKAFKKHNGEIGYAFNVQQQQINSRGIRF